LSKKYVIIDLGASNGRISLGDFDGCSISIKTLSRFENGGVRSKDKLLWNVSSIFMEMKKGIKKAISENREIISISLDAWGVDFGFLDKNKKLISNPVHYRDASKQNDASIKFLEMISQKELFEKTAGYPFGICPLFYLYNMKLLGNPILKNSRYFLMMPDLFNFMLTSDIYS
jgi:rhamnulokinase